MSHSCVASENTHVQFQHWRQLEGSEFKFLTFFCLSSKKGKKKRTRAAAPPEPKSNKRMEREKPHKFLIRLLQLPASENKKTSPYSRGVLGRKGDKPPRERWPSEMAETWSSHGAGSVAGFIVVCFISTLAVVASFSFVSFLGGFCPSGCFFTL